MMTASQATAATPLSALGEAQRGGGDSGVDKVFRAAFVVALGVIIFVAGALMSAANIFPGPEIAAAYQGGRALYEKLGQTSDPYSSDLWKPERTSDKGVTVFDRAAVQPGFTLYASGDSAAAYLMDTDGRVLHEWHRPYSSVWNETAKVKNPQPDAYVYFRKVKMYPNGDLLALTRRTATAWSSSTATPTSSGGSSTTPITISTSGRTAASTC
jgi:hypothetical protein